MKDVMKNLEEQKNKNKMRTSKLSKRKFYKVVFVYSF